MDVTTISIRLFLATWCLPGGLFQITMTHCPIENINGIQLLNCSHSGVQSISQHHINAMGSVFNRKPQSLNTIDFSHNHVSQIEAGAFSNIENLKVLDLSFNRLSSSFGLNECIFSKVHERIEKLNLANNPISTVNPHLFASMSGESVHLTHLNLSRCSLSTIHRQSFMFLTQLKTLDLSSNMLKDITWIEGFEMIESIDLTENKMISLPDSMLQSPLPVSALLMTSHERMELTFRLDYISIAEEPISWERISNLGLRNSPWKCTEKKGFPWRSARDMATWHLCKLHKQIPPSMFPILTEGQPTHFWYYMGVGSCILFSAMLIFFTIVVVVSELKKKTKKAVSKTRSMRAKCSLKKVPHWKGIPASFPAFHWSDNKQHDEKRMYIIDNLCDLSARIMVDSDQPGTENEKITNKPKDKDVKEKY